MKIDGISIIVVNYNGLKWLKTCLDSLFSQTYDNFEIIFVDNGSTDDSLKFLKENYKDNRLKIIKNEKNLGFAGGNNIGIDNSIGEFILMLNNDTFVEKDFLKNMIEFYVKNNYDIIAPFQCSYDKKNKYEYYPGIDFIGNSVMVNRKKMFYISGVCLFFNKNFYKETKGLDNNFFMYSEETDWFWRINLLNKKFSYVENLYVYHFGSGSTGCGIKYLSFLWRNQNLLQMLIKNYFWYNLIWVLPIYFIQNIFEIMFFLIILKPKIAFSYIEGWMYNIKNIKKILKNRKWVQENRIISDFEIMKKMYFGLGKLNHLWNFIINKLNKNEI